MDTKLTKKSLVYFILLIVPFSIISSLATFFISQYFYNKKTNYFSNNITKVVEVASYDNEDSKSYGTGWFIDKSTILTNYHVVSHLSNGVRIDFDSIDIRFYDETIYEAVKIIKYDAIKDIALLSYNGTHNYQAFKRTNNYQTSDRCLCIGNYQNYGLSYKEGFVSLKSVNLVYNECYQDYIQLSISIGQGDSGAPVFNEDNEIIGMITFRNKGSSGYIEECFGYAIPITTINQFI